MANDFGDGSVQAAAGASEGERLCALVRGDALGCPHRFPTTQVFITPALPGARLPCQTQVFKSSSVSSQFSSRGLSLPLHLQTGFLGPCLFFFI